MDENGVFSTTHLLSVSYPLVLPPPPPSSSSRVSRRYARSGSSELSGDEMGDGNIRTLAEWHGGERKRERICGARHECRWVGSGFILHEYTYRVVHRVVHYILLTSQFTLRVAISIKRLYCDRTCVLMSTKGSEQPDGPPFTFGGYSYFHLVLDRHHFDNPAYGNSSNGGAHGSSSGYSSGGVLPIHGSPMPMAAVAVASGDDHIINI